MLAVTAETKHNRPNSAKDRSDLGALLWPKSELVRTDD